MPLSNKDHFYWSVLENLQGDVAILDAQHRYIYVNPYAVHDPSIREWIVGKTDQEYCEFRGLSTEIAHVRREKFNRAMETRNLVEWEETFVDREGRPRVFIRRIHPILNKELNRVTYLIGHGLDITERRKVREELEANKRFTDAVINASPHLIFVKDSENRLVMANQAVADLFRRTPEELIQKSLYEVHPRAEEVDAHNANDKWVLLEGKPLRVEEKLTQDDGRVIWYDTVKVPLVDAQGKMNVLGISTDITERKYQEDELRKRQRELNEAQELAKAGSFEFDLQKKRITWSDGMYKIWELDKDSTVLSLEAFTQTVHPEDLPVVAEKFKHIFENDEPWVIDYRIITPSGKVKHIEVISKFRVDEEGRKVKLMGSCQDISLKKTYEETILLNEQRLIEAQQLANMGSWEMDLDPVFSIRWSTGCFNIWERDEVLGAPDPDSIYGQLEEESRIALKELMDHLISTGQDIELRFSANTFKGNPRIFLGKAKARFNHEGKVVKIYGTIIDITEQERTRHILQLSEERLIQAQQIARMASWQYDIATGEMEWAKGTCLLMERDEKAAELSIADFRALVYPDDLERFEEAMLMASRGDDEQVVEIRLQIQGRPLKYIEVRGRSIRNNAGVIHKLFGTVIDITDRKMVEAELVRAHKQAEESVKTKELFLANISHELRTPLNGIIGMTRLLRRTSLNTTQREYLDVLGSTASNLQVIISDILDFTKIEAGKLVLEEISFDPTRTAESAIQLQMEKAEEKNIILRHLHTGQYAIPLVVGDPHRLSQILLNLLNNAIKFTNHGEVVLYHEVLEEDEKTAKIRFSVRDTGIGIPKVMQRSIFESFTQVDQDEKANIGGIGLGLSISKSLVERQGGSIWVESEVGEGSSFHFIIPYRKASLLTDKTSRTLNEPALLGPLRILLAEDNKVNQFLTESLLRDWGLQVDVAANGREAVQLAESNDYDMILMDIQMPDMNGMEATLAIRRFADRRRSGVPVIALTANTSRLAHRQFLTAGMNDWLVKPFRDEALYRKIVRHIEERDLSPGRVQTRKFPIRRMPPTDENRLYDLSSLKKNTPENPQFIKRMLGIFIDTIPPIVERMYLHFENKEMDEVSALAHKIKPTLDGAGIISLRETIRNLELHREKRRTKTQISEDMSRLRSVISEVVEEFKKVISSNP